MPIRKSVMSIVKSILTAHKFLQVLSAFEQSTQLALFFLLMPLSNLEFLRDMAVSAFDTR